MVSGVLTDKHAGAGLLGKRDGRSKEELFRATQGMVVPVGLGIVLIIGHIHAAYDNVYSPEAEFHFEPLQYGVACHIHLVGEFLPQLSYDIRIVRIID